MTHNVERSALVPYSALQMFELVNNIESYPQFMNNCVDARVLRRGDGWLDARLELQKAGISQSFVTRNQLEPPTRMTMSLLEGPFSRLDGCWTFTDLDERGCQVHLKLEFDMQNRWLSLAAGKFFETAASQQVDALCRRARQVYGDS